MIGLPLLWLTRCSSPTSTVPNGTICLVNRAINTFLVTRMTWGPGTQSSPLRASIQSVASNDRGTGPSCRRRPPHAGLTSIASPCSQVRPISPSPAYFSVDTVPSIDSTCSAARCRKIVGIRHTVHYLQILVKTCWLRLRHLPTVLLKVLLRPDPRWPLPQESRPPCPASGGASRASSRTF
jgi:hypothetical protein